jgi:hypothetical protein
MEMIRRAIFNLAFFLSAVIVTGNNNSSPEERNIVLHATKEVPGNLYTHDNQVSEEYFSFSSLTKQINSYQHYNFGGIDSYD